MAMSNSMVLSKKLVSMFHRRAAARWGDPRRRRQTLSVEGLEHRLCPSPVLLVADANGNQVLAYDAATGAFRTVYVAPGSGGLDTPDLGIIGGPDGNVYVNSYGSGSTPVNSVARYDGTTGAPLPSAGRTGANFVTPNDGGLQGTEGLAFGTDGLLYVANDTTQPEYGGVPGNILRFNGTTGDFVGVFVPSGSGGLSYANDLHFGPDGNLYVDNSTGAGKDHGKILRYDATTGAPLPAAGRDGANFITPNDGGLSWANGFAFGPDGNLYVANDFTPNGPSNILRFDGTTGNFVDVFISSGLGFVDGIAWGPDGHLYVTNNTSTQASVNRYDGSGNLIDVFIAPGSGGLQFASGLLFWDLPDASAPPGRAESPGAWSDSHSIATQSYLVGSIGLAVDGTVGAHASSRNLAVVDRFFDLADVRDQPFVPATVKRTTLAANARQETGVAQRNTLAVDDVLEMALHLEGSLSSSLSW